MLYASLAEVAYPEGFPPVETVEDETYYLGPILPKSQADLQLPSGYGITLKGGNKVAGSVDFNHHHADDIFEISDTLHPNY